MFKEYGTADVIGTGDSDALKKHVYSTMAKHNIPDKDMSAIVTIAKTVYNGVLWTVNEDDFTKEVDRLAKEYVEAHKKRK